MLRSMLMVATVAALVGCQRPNNSAREEMKDTTAGANEELRNTQQKDMGGQAATEKQGERTTVEGTLSKVDAEQIEVKTNTGDTVDLKLGANVMSPDGTPMSNAQLIEGSDVRASYSEKNGDKIIETIEIIQPGAAPQPGGGAPAPGGSAPPPTNEPIK